MCFASSYAMQSSKRNHNRKVMDKTYKSIKIGAGEYRDLRAYAERAGMKIQAVLTKWIREGLARQNGQPQKEQA